MTVPAIVVTETSVEPTVPAGATILHDVAEFTTKLFASTPPILTLLAFVKLVPVIVMAVPAVSGPEIGLKDVMVGAATYVNAFVLITVPPIVVTEIFLTPTEPAGVRAEME